MEIHQILQKHYQLSNCSISSLEGYDSTNYKVASDQGDFVLKKYQYTAQTYTILENENQILKTLCQIKEYDFPKIIATSEDVYSLIHNGHIFRLLTFVQGEFLGDVVHSDQLVYDFGAFLAKLDKQLSDLYLPAIAAKQINWDLQHFKLNHKLIEYIEDIADRSLVNYFFMQFDENVYPHSYDFRKGLIHNDGNDWNVLTSDQNVSGIIDFGDSCYSWLVNEIAVALTYVMMGKTKPLDTASQLIKGYNDIIPLKESELDVLYYLIAARLCISVCNSAYAKTLKPDSEYITVSEKPAWDLLRHWLSINPIKAKDTFRSAVGLPPTIKIETNHLLDLRKKVISNALSLSYKQPIPMNQSAFQYMYDAHGNTFLDAYNNIMLVGHSHPKVVHANQKQSAKLNTNTRYLYQNLLSYSEKLLATFPRQLNKIFFVNSGSAASDLAVRLAVNHTKRQKVMVVEHGYHGNTSIGIDISSYKYNQTGGKGKQSFVVETAMPKAFNSNFTDDGTAGEHFSNQTRKQILENTNEVAAFIAEPIVGCGGQVPLAKGYLKSVYKTLKSQGVVCISDEVQVGFGRLGDFFWGFEMHEVIPDMVIIGKPMGNGHPIAAVITTSEIAKSFENGLEFFSSFGGNPVSCAIAEAVLDVIQEEGLQQKAKSVGDYLMNALNNLKTDFKEVADVRGSGLFIGVEILDQSGNAHTVLAQTIKNSLRENHILIGTDGPNDNVLKIKPPLSFNKTNADTLVAAIRKVLLQFEKK